MNILERLSAIHRQLLRTNDMGAVLKSLMDAALEISGAKNGLLLLRNDGSGGPLDGYGVVVARNLSQEDLGKDEFRVSLSAVREAMETGEAVVTDNALQDPRFQKSKSVELHHLKSILALPLKDASGVMGVFYLDNPLDAGVFQDETVTALRAFADAAALALQKSRMIEDLRKSNSELAVEVEEESSRRHDVEREMAESRLKLKHEYGEIVGRSPKMVQVLQLMETESYTSLTPQPVCGQTLRPFIQRIIHTEE